ncbi:MAG: hypothetical protein ACFFDT_18115 [Candidatus Hodarchaeota archaeon]
MDEVPFISITFGEANRSLEEPSLIVKLLKEKKINPKEADLLEKLGSYSQTPNPKILQEIEELCIQHFGDEGIDAFNKLSRFIKSSDKRVAWVLFSRHFQRIEYDDRNPLEGYNPRVSEVLTISSKYKLIK